MPRWLLIKLKRGGAIVLDEFYGSLAELPAETAAAPFAVALRFLSSYEVAVFGTAFLAATARPSRRAMKTLSHYVTNTTHIARHQRFICDAHAVAKECGLSSRAHAPREVVNHAIYALGALAPPSCRPLERADFEFAAPLVLAAAPQVAAASGAGAPGAAAAPGAHALGYETDATIAESVATVLDE